VREAVAAEREKLKHELLTLEKWKGMALAKDGDGRTVQEIEREAREAEREECAKIAFNAKTYLEAAHLIRERGAP
jgi:Ribonuclease G/E